MKIRLTLLIGFMILMSGVCRAQELNNKVLLTVGKNKVEAGEFIRMYNKSLEPGKKQDVDSYLQQYLVFKLKVADAVQAGYDTTRSFKNELNGYRNQLAQNYLTDNLTKEKLLKKAYQRSLNEINGWHILITMPQEASPEDTLKAWQKATDVRERIIRGEPFEEVARSTSDDPSVKVNGGNLGYFSVFQMIMPFEDAAYSLKKGAVSMPVRTPYGYHIIKVTDKRPSKGKILVAHIMKSAPPGTNEKDDLIAKGAIDSIYSKLQAGIPFSELAKKYSDHKESATKGGELNWFGAGEVVSDFSEASFAITDTGKYTKPVRTNYGWHIIKLLNRKTPGTFEESKSFLESKINQSYLNSISKKTFIERLKKEYRFKINQTAFDWFVLNTDTLIIQGLKKYNSDSIPEGNLYSFANQFLTNKEFANYIEKRGSMIVTKDSLFFINSSIETRSSDDIINYENSVLEIKYPEFRYLMQEFHDGILLFEISGENVWNKVSDDSLGLYKYYQDHKSEHLSRQAIEGKIYSISSLKEEKSFRSAFLKFSTKPDLDARLNKMFNKKNDTILTIKSGKWLSGDDADLDKIEWQTGTQSFNKNGLPAIINILNVIDPVPLSFDEVRGEMMVGYQEFLESDWIRQLKQKFTVKIDNKVLEDVKKKLNNE